VETFSSRAPSVVSLPWETLFLTSRNLSPDATFYALPKERFSSSHGPPEPFFVGSVVAQYDPENFFGPYEVGGLCSAFSFFVTLISFYQWDLFPSPLAFNPLRWFSPLLCGVFPDSPFQLDSSCFVFGPQLPFR